MPARNRCVTGIEGLDAALNGGFPEGNIVLLSGACGTGKTTLGIEFLTYGAERGENGVYFSVTEPYEKLLNNMRAFNFFSERLVEENKLFIIDVPLLYSRLGLLGKDSTIEDIDTLLWALVDTVRALNIKRAVIDSITAVCSRLAQKSKIRELVFNLSRMFTRFGVTTIMISELSKETKKYSTYEVEEAVADGIIMLKDLERMGNLMRTLQVVKMRGTAHSRSKYVMDISTEGALMVPLLKWGITGE